jgi:quinol monooxygenase YgiN
MIIVSGRILLRAGKRLEFMKQSFDSMVQARRAHGCLDFVVAADPIEEDRVNIYEAWESEDALLAFRGQGPGEDISSLIVGANVARHIVASTGRA